MASISQLLEQYGPPPPDILRDWAWQFHDAASKLYHLNHPTPLGRRYEADDSFHWTSIQVSSTGRLQLAGVPASALQAALSDLRQWLKSASASSPGVTVSRSPRKRKSSHDLKRRLKVQIAVTATSIVLLLVTVAFVVTRASRKPTQPDAAHLVDQQVGPGQRSDDRSPDRQSSDEVHPSQSTTVELWATDSAPVGAEIDTMLAQSASDPGMGSSLSPDLSLDTKASVDAPLPETATEISRSDAVTSNSSDGPADVMQQVTEAMQNAQAAETQAPDDPGAARDGARQVVLNRDQLRTPVPAAHKAGSRTKPSSWSLMVDCPEGFACAPAPTQTLDAKSRCLWQLFDQASNSPRACLVIHASQRKGRSGAAELLFFGSAEDLPQVTLPLNRKFLDPLLSSLQVSQVQLQLLIESLSQAKPPAEVRAQIAQQKKLATEQMKLCKRLIEVVAQCDRLADLVDGQVTLTIEEGASSQ